MSRSKASGLVIIDLFIFIYFSSVLFLSIVMTDFITNSYLSNLSKSITTLFSIVLTLLFFVLIPSIIYFILPKLEVGKHSFPSSKMSLVWILKFYIKKPLTLPIISNFIFSLHFLSYLILKLLRSDVTTAFQIAANAELRDPEIIAIGPGATIGSDTILAPHKMTPTHLELFRITIEEDVSIGAFCKIGPGVTIGKGTRIGNNVAIHSHTKIEANCTIADCAMIQENCHIKDNSIIKAYALLEKRTTIESKSIVETSYDTKK
jgi:acetyltransferase-like isoleucine patch superfamily enzyme